MIELTEQAAAKVKQHLAQRGHGLGIKIGVKTTGCSGLAYVLEYVDKPSLLKPIVIDTRGVSVYIETKDMAYLAGLKLDYKRQGLNEGFDFINPNEVARCGCGESFKI